MITKRAYFQMEDGCRFAKGSKNGKRVFWFIRKDADGVGVASQTFYDERRALRAYLSNQLLYEY